MSSIVSDPAPSEHAATAQPSSIRITELSLVLMALIWGVNFSVVKFGTTLIDPLAYNGVRVAIAAILLSAIVMIGRLPLPSMRTIGILLALGVIGNGVYQYFFVTGIALTRAGDAALVIAASPAFIAIIGRVLGVETLRARHVIGIAASMFGIGLVLVGTSADDGHSSLTGLMLVLLGSVAWALYSVLVKPYTESIGGTQLSAITMVGGAVPLFVVSWPAVSHARWSKLPVAGWAAIGYSACLALVVAYFFWYRGVRTIGPTRAAMYSNLQPVAAVLVAWGMLGEVPTMWQIVGAVFIVGSLWLARA